MVEAVLSDIDGTLVESNWLHAAAWKDAFAVIDIPLDIETLRRQIGKGGDQLIPVFVPWWKRPMIEEPLEAYRSFVFHQDYFHKVEPFPKVRDLFLRLKHSGIRIALASSSAKKDLATYQRIAHISDLVDETTSADDTDRSKPHPDIFSATLEKLHAKASNVLALGDTPYDAESAGKAGIRTIGVTTGGWSRQELLDAGCIEVYKDVGELLERFDQSALTNYGHRTPPS
jgi:HAD superfamily hydrolase (TIGR01509 family)